MPRPYPAALTAALLLLTHLATAQTRVTGLILEPSGEPAVYANVVLLAAADSAFVAGAVTELDGTYVLEADAAPGQYLLRASAIGLADAYSSGFGVSPNQASYPQASLTLGTSDTELATATVTAERPTIERLIDRTIVNVANDATAVSQTALQVLERAPGVYVDRVGGAISMLGKDGVNVMINGRLNYMQPDAVLAFLAGIPASDIVRLELITTPPAELDAAGNAGYIDIVLRRLPDEGLTGSFTATAGGVVNPAEFDDGAAADLRAGAFAAIGSSATYRRGKVSAFGNVSYTRNETPSSTYLRRTGATDEGTLRSSLNFLRDPTRDVLDGRLGLDLSLSERTTLGLLASGYVNRFVLDGDQRNVFGIGSAPDSLLRTDLTEQNDWRHLQTGVSLTHELGDGGEFSAGADYLYYDNANPIDYALDYSDVETGAPLRSAELASRKDSPFGIAVGRLDYERPIGEGRLSIGAKAVVADFENDVTLRRDGVLDEGFSSESVLDESILAAYTQYTGAVALGGEGERQLDYRLGLRYERTATRVAEIGETAPVVDRNYGNLFPSVALGYPLTKHTKVTAGYSRRIERPAFTDIAPFVIFLDPRTQFGGNTSLQPALSQNLELGVQRGGLGLTLAYSYIDSAIVGFQDRFDAELGRQVIQPVNLREQSVYSATLGLPTPLADWWRGRLTATLSYTEAVTVLESGEVTRDQVTLQVGGGQNFTLAEGWRLSASGFFGTPSVSGYTRGLAIGTLNLALERSLPGGTLTLAVEDALNTFRARGETVVPEIGFASERGFNFSGPTAKLTWAARFGNNRVKALDRDSASEERGRVN